MISIQQKRRGKNLKTKELAPVRFKPGPLKIINNTPICFCISRTNSWMDIADDSIEWLYTVRCQQKLRPKLCTMMSSAEIDPFNVVESLLS